MATYSAPDICTFIMTICEYDIVTACSMGQVRMTSSTVNYLTISQFKIVANSININISIQNQFPSVFTHFFIAVAVFFYVWDMKCCIVYDT